MPELPSWFWWSMWLITGLLIAIGLLFDVEQYVFIPATGLTIVLIVTDIGSRIR